MRKRVGRRYRENLGLSPIPELFEKAVMGPLLMGFLVLGTAIGVVYTKHLSRSLHIQLQQQQNIKDKFHIEWTQLLLEQGTLGSDVRVEKVAREQLNMIVPPSNQVVVIQP